MKLMDSDGSRRQVAPPQLTESDSAFGVLLTPAAQSKKKASNRITKHLQPQPATNGAAPAAGKPAADTKNLVKIGLGLSLILIAISAVVWQWRSSVPVAAPQLFSYYTTDDGKTTFLADSSNGASFDKDGQLAVQAVMFTVDNNQSRFVGYLKRLPKAMQSSTNLVRPPSVSLEVKRPGESKWAPQFSPQGSKTTAVKAPNGKTKPVEVTPQPAN